MQSLGDGVIRQVFEKLSIAFVPDRARCVGAHGEREIARRLVVCGLRDEIPVDFRAPPLFKRIEGKVATGSPQKPFGESARPRL